MIHKGVKHYCCEPLDHIENYDIAIADTTQTWDCHHRLEISLQLSRKELIKYNLYYNRPACELIFMRATEHNSLHKSQPSHRTAMKEVQKEVQNRPEVKAKRSAAQKEAFSRPEVKAKRSAAAKEAQNRPETKAKISAANKDLIRINNGVTNRYVKPNELDNYLVNGWVRGMLKK